MTRRNRSIAAIRIEAQGTPLGPRVLLTIADQPVVMTTREAKRLAEWLHDAAELADLDNLEQGPL